MTAPGIILDHHGAPITAEAANTYEATGTARLSDWGLGINGPTQSLYGSIATLRSRARDAYRNNALAHAGVDSFVSNLTGTDISPAWQLKNSEQREELHEVFMDSVPELDFYGTQDFYGLEAMACRAMIQDGEVLGRLIDQPASSGLLVPLQVQLLEADHLDAGYNDIAPNGNEIRYGIEWHGGRRTAYWLEKEHPGERFLTNSGTGRTRVNAADILHVFRPVRPGQARGASWLAPILVKLREIDLYDDAEVVRKKAAAMWGGFIYSDAPVHGAQMGATTTTQAAGGAQSISMEPGTFPILRQGQKIEFSKTTDVGNNYRDFLKVQFSIVASGLGITYEQLTGDLEGVTYSSIRAGLIEFRRLCETLQLQTIIFQFCRPIINRWIKAAVLNRAVKSISIKEYLANPRKFHRVEWQPDGFDYVDPVKDRIADALDVRHGFDSRTGIVSRRGRSADRVDQENAADSTRAAALGLVYDSDPSQTDHSGAIQDVETAAINQSAKEDK